MLTEEGHSKTGDWSGGTFCGASVTHWEFIPSLRTLVLESFHFKSDTWNHTEPRSSPKGPSTWCLPEHAGHTTPGSNHQPNQPTPCPKGSKYPYSRYLVDIWAPKVYTYYCLVPRLSRKRKPRAILGPLDSEKQEGAC